MGEEEGEVFELENAETEEGDEEEKKSSLFLPLSLQPCDGMHSSRLLLAGGRLVFLRVKGDESDGEIPLPLRLYGGGGLERSARSPALGHILRRGGPTEPRRRFNRVNSNRVDAESASYAFERAARAGIQANFIGSKLSGSFSFNRSLTCLVDRDTDAS